MKRTLSALTCLLALTFVTSSSAGRPDKSWKSWFGHVSGGWVMGQSEFGDIHDDDWQLAGGATWWTQDSPIGLDLELSWSQFDMSRKAIDYINDELDPDGGKIDGGDTEIWSFTTDAIWSPDTGGALGFFVAGGIGAYRLDSRVTNQGLVYYPPVCDPWYWWCYPGGVGPGTIVRASNATTEWGWNVGVGINFEMSSGSQLYLEAKYHAVQTDGATTEYIPIMVGYRW